MITIVASKKHVQKHKTQPLSKKQKHHDIYATHLIFFGASWPCHCLIASWPRRCLVASLPRCLVAFCLGLALARLWQYVRACAPERRRARSQARTITARLEQNSLSKKCAVWCPVVGIIPLIKNPDPKRGS